MTAEEALLIWLEVYPFQDLGRLPDKELKKTLTAIWEDLTALSLPQPVEVRTEPEETDEVPGMLTRIITGTPEHLNVAFVHALDPQRSAWIEEHDLARRYMQQIMGDKVSVKSYYNANTPEEAEALLDQAIHYCKEFYFFYAVYLSKVSFK